MIAKHYLSRLYYKFSRIENFLLHPSLPLGFLTDLHTDKDTKKLSFIVWLVTWSPDSNHPKKLVKTIESKVVPLLEFSDDGKWLVLNYMADTTTETIMIPISKKDPQFLGKPLSLGQMSTFKGVTWTSNPASFIVLEKHRLLRWNLHKKKE